MPWLLILIILIGYGRSIPIYFSGDDWVFLDRAVKGWDLSSMFSFSPGSFAPLINTAFFLFYKLFQLNHIYYHLTALSIHSLNCILFFCIARELSKNKMLAILAAILFSVFSPYNQIVIWVSGLAGLITSAFFLFSFYSFAIYRRNRRSRHYLLSLCSFIFSLLCKEWAIMVFAIFIAYDIFFYRRERPFSKLVPAYIPFVVLLAVYIAAELCCPYSGKKDMLGPHIFSNLSTYLTTLILPSQNISEFPLKALVPFLSNLIPFLAKIFSILIPVLSLTAVIWCPNFIKFFTVWLYVNLFPFLFFSWGTASRYYYIPSMGFAAILASIFLYLTKLWKIALSVCLSIFIIVHISFLELRISKLYRQNRTPQFILRQLQEMHPAFPPHSRLFFFGFQYDRKWGYAVRTLYRDPTLIIYRRPPVPQELEEMTAPVFIFDYQNKSLLPLSPSSLR